MNNYSLHASRRSPGEYDEPHSLRRRLSPRAELSTHFGDIPTRLEDRDGLELDPFADAFRARTLRSEYDDSHYGQSTAYDGLDTIPLTPTTRSHKSRSGSAFHSALSTPTRFPDAQRHLDAQEVVWRPESSRTESVHTAKSASSSTTVVSSSAVTLARPELGVLGKFTNKWPKPLPLKSTGGRSSFDDLDLTDTELKKSVDAVLLESGIGGGSGILGLEWFSRWTGFKWCLLFSVLSVLVYGIAGLSCAVGIWFRIWHNADVMYVADDDVLVLITLASSILVFTALVGLAGTLLSSRPILAIYALLLWPCFISMCAIGYTTYKRVTFALDQKLDMSWSQYYTPYGRLLVQNSLKCCGWSSPNHGGTPSRTCYPRTPLPGCKGSLTRFEQANLQLVWSTVFSLVPMHLVNIVVVMLCANHVTRTFGTGITPKRYRLTAKDVQEDAGRIVDWLQRKGRLALKAADSIKRPVGVRAPPSRVFREDREETMGLLDKYSG